jgi:lysophospholipase L1-like esterase
LLYFLGVALLVSLVAWQVKRYSNDALDTSAFDLAQHLWAKNLGPHKAGAEGEDGPPAPPTPGGLPGLGGGSPAAAPDVNEEPPLPPPSLPGQDSAPFKGQAIEEGCRKTGAKGCELSAMDPFYHQLARVLRKEPGAVARISHFGDSILASDYVSSRARERLQDTFGDAGHGFLFIGQPSRWYFQEGVEHDSSSGWDARGITSDKKAKDGLYGLGGATFEAQGPGHKASFGTITPKPGKEKPSQRFGQKVSRFEVYYLAQPDGGEVLMSIDGKERETLSTKGDAVASAVASYEVEDGAHTLSLKSVSGRVRAFGVVMERDIPGVVYDSMGLVSGSVRALLSIDEKHWAEQLKRRNPGLVILMYGTNEANYTSSSDKGIAEYEEGLREALRRVRGALPESSCLLVAPPDTDEEKGGAMVTKSALPRMIEAQRRAALDEGCAYWDTFSWMGGKNSMAGWVKRGFGQSDYAHPTKKGAAKIGDAFVDALLAGYGAYAARAGATP